MSNTLRGRSSFNIIFGIVALFLVAIVFLKPIMRCFFPVKYIDIVKQYSNEYNIDAHLIMAVIRTESKFKEDAESDKGAKGLMQLKDDTAKWCAKEFGFSYDGDITNPETNIKIGCAYLRYLIDKFGNVATALAAYNAGEGNVTQWLEKQGSGMELTEIPFGETKRYVELVQKREKIYNFLY